MKKSEQIVEFIRENNPRRKDLVKFIVVNLNKKLTSEEWDALPSTDSLHAYYATNITKWKRQGNIVVDAKTKRYSMSKYYNGKLYGITNKAQIERSENRAENWKSNYDNLKRNNEINNRIKDKQLVALRNQVDELTAKLEEIRSII